MSGEENRAQLAGIASRRSYLRPSLPPLSVARRNPEEWPQPGCDDLGVWPQPQTPRDPGSNPFQFKREKLAFFDKQCSRIADHVYLGSDSVAKNRDILIQNKISHVLNCVGFVCPEYFKNDLVYRTLWLQDTPEEDITSVLYDVFDYLEDVRVRGGRVLVHCFNGVSRSNSLVIAYLIWRKELSYEEVLRDVKSKRGVTNPNMGFSCQLLQCQDRVHAVPSSPSSALRMYRIAPHSPYDPLHLVPKMVSDPGAHRLDSRGAFIVHVPYAIYVWIGKICSPMMENRACLAASQVIRYERARGPIVKVKDGEEPSEFWDALEVSEAGFGTHIVRIVKQYDSDFEIFYKALDGGVVPPFSVSNAETETCLPVRENGWGRIRRKISNGIMKGFIMSSEQSCGDMIVEEEEDSFTYFPSNSPRFSAKSPTLSPSNSDYLSSFTFSSSSSNWSDLSQRLCSPVSGFSHDLTFRVSSDYPDKEVSLSSIDELVEVPKDLVRSWSFSSMPYLDDEVMRDDLGCKHLDHGGDQEELMVEIEFGNAHMLV